jgi:hypothetical protein
MGRRRGNVGRSPQFCDSNHLQCAMNRLLSGARSALNGADGISDIEGKATRVGASERGKRTSFNGVTTGAGTPRIRSVMVFLEPMNIVETGVRYLQNSAKQLPIPAAVPAISLLQSGVLFVITSNMKRRTTALPQSVKAADLGTSDHRSGCKQHGFAVANH